MDESAKALTPLPVGEGVNKKKRLLVADQSVKCWAPHPPIDKSCYYQIGAFFL